ncbi:Adenine deaminase [bioreactor metagenome]|uniref:adenine deaminase n=2 Tax=root TaxID=1 RepID=A0A644XXV2_9ZZZZ
MGPLFPVLRSATLSATLHHGKERGDEPVNVSEYLAVARGDRPADLVLRGARVANVFTLEYEEADVALYGDRIAGVGKGYGGVREEDLSGMVIVPGFIDGHCHIESTMLTPAAFSELAAVRGTASAAPDPHEIANTCGMAGVEYMWRESLNCPVDLFFTAPSCVPASSFETPFEELDAKAVAEMFARGWCDSLGEVMNYPGVIGGDPALWAKIYASGTRAKSGHAPGLTGKDLCAYLLSGCDSDHESFSAEEGLDKLRRGMTLMIREGATEHNLEDLACLVRENEARSSRCMMVSDDLSARYLRDRGHMDEKIRLAVRHGISPLAALRMVTLTPAEYFGWKDRGAVAPGRIADLAAVDSLENCSVKRVWKRGRLTARDGRLLCGPVPRVDAPVSAKGNVSVPGKEAFEIYAPGGAKIRVVGLRPGQVVTNHLTTEPAVSDGLAVADPSRDLSWLAVLEKNRGTGRLALGFVSGLGLKEGAIGSSVAHDAHNFVAAGTDILSLRTALEFLASEGGGIVAARGGDVLGSLGLPVGGLMNPGSADEVISGLEAAEEAARSLGTGVDHPFMAMSFLSLSVIPELKLTDQGYVDLGRGGIQSLFTE